MSCIRTVIGFELWESIWSLFWHLLSSWPLSSHFCRSIQQPLVIFSKLLVILTVPTCNNMTAMHRALRLWRGVWSKDCFTTGPCGERTPLYPFASSHNQIIVSQSNHLRLQNHVIPSAALMALWWCHNSRRLLETPRVSLWACSSKGMLFRIVYCCDRNHESSWTFAKTRCIFSKVALLFRSRRMSLEGRSSFCQL